MAVKRHDPDKLRYKFWREHPWCAPREVVWEDGYIHYNFVQGYHPTRVFTELWKALERLWGVSKGHVSAARYLEYMSSRMPADELELVAEALKTGLHGADFVVGDCTFENIVVSGLRVYFIDPGHPRGLCCRELDLAKMLQSMRGWEGVKRPKTMYIDRLPIDFNTQTKQTVALYITHLYRLLKHDHPEHALEWARREIQLAKENLLHRLGRDVAS